MIDFVSVFLEAENVKRVSSEKRLAGGAGGGNERP